MGVTRERASRAKKDNKQDKPPLLVEGVFSFGQGGFSFDQQEARMPEVFDLLPKYFYGKEHLPRDWTPITKTIILRCRDVRGNIEELPMDVSLAPAFMVSNEGVGEPVFPGRREELVERAIRNFAMQQVTQTGLHIAELSRTQIIQVTFVLGQLRQELSSQGHGYELSELKQALAVLSKAMISLSYSRECAVCKINAAVFSNLLYIYEDEDGERSHVSVNYHPLATNAVVNLARFSDELPSRDEPAEPGRPLACPTQVPPAMRGDYRRHNGPLPFVRRL